MVLGSDRLDFQMVLALGLDHLDSQMALELELDRLAGFHYCPVSVQGAVIHRHLDPGLLVLVAAVSPEVH